MPLRSRMPCRRAAPLAGLMFLMLLPLAPVAHARDELGISDLQRARPVQAALASAATFAVGAAMPLLCAALTPASALAPVVTGMSLLLLAVLGGLAARAGGARAATGAVRVTFWGALAMAITYGIGRLFGAVV